MKLIADCRHWWRLWSVRAGLLGLVLSLIQTINPQALLNLVNALPAEVHDALPSNWVVIVKAVLFALVVLLRLIPQKIPGRAPDAADGQ